MSGPHENPTWCQLCQREVEQLRAELAESHAQLKAANFDRRELADRWQAEIEAHAKTQVALRDAREYLRLRTEDYHVLRRAWALRELEIAPSPFPEHWAREFPESVADLIRAGAGCPIGECDICGRRAPLATAQLGMHCAPGWPCVTGGA